MSSLRDTLDTSIFRCCFQVKAAIATFLCMVLASSSHIALSENFFSILCPTFCLDLIVVFKESSFSF